MAWIGDSVVLLPGIILVGLVADGVYAWRRPLTDPDREFRAFVAGVPACYFLTYFVTVDLTGGIAWVVHIWTGAVDLAGFAGLLLSYVALPGERTGADLS